MNLPERFADYITKERLFSKKDTLLLAVSGGVDSVILCELCYRAGFSFLIAHCNFQLRGEESERDERFVRSLGERYGVEVLVKRFNTDEYAKNEKVSIQVAARHLRYSWFNDLVGGNWTVPGATASADSSQIKRADYLLTAHHADDNIETLLMNFFKGTGVSGLRAMLPKQDTICRPLLLARKNELLQFANENQLAWMEDSSNRSGKYSRNQLRHTVIPSLSAVYPSVEENLLKNIDRFRDIELLYQQRIEAILAKLLIRTEAEVRIPVLRLKQLPAIQTICYEIIKPYNFTSAQAVEMVSLLDAETGKYLQSSSHRVIRYRNMLIIAPLPAAQAETIVIDSGDENIVVNGKRIVFSILSAASASLETDPTIASLDAEKIQFPLILRKRKQGDYFYPLGLRKKKKISRFLSDIKLSVPQKENIWLLEMDKKIIWVVNHRIDDRFKVTDNTKNILRINLTSVK